VVYQSDDDAISIYALDKKGHNFPFLEIPILKKSLKIMGLNIQPLLALKLPF